MKILFVCLGNICRSPSAEAIFRSRAAKAGLNIDVQSAGTAAWHVGSPPDPRSQKAGEARGYSFAGLRARQVSVSDFTKFDYILAMDRQNLQRLTALRQNDATAQVKLLLDFAPDENLSEVPDPYYGGKDGFEQVIDLIEAASDGIIAHLQSP